MSKCFKNSLCFYLSDIFNWSCFLEDEFLVKKTLNSPFIYTLNNLCISYSSNFKCQHFTLGYFLCIRSTTRITLILQFFIYRWVTKNYYKLMIKVLYKLLCYKVDDDIFWQAVHGQVCNLGDMMRTQKQELEYVIKLEPWVLASLCYSLVMRIQLPNPQGWPSRFNQEVCFLSDFCHPLI